MEDKDPFANCPNEVLLAPKVKINKKNLKKNQKKQNALTKEKTEIEGTGGNISKLPPVRVRHDRDSTNGNLDIQLDNINVQAGGKDLLIGADVQIIHGQKYGLIGRNGVGKTTLLSALARGDFPGVPAHIQILAVEQEISGISKTPLEYVLETDMDRLDLLQREQDLLEKGEENMAEELQEVYNKLEEIDAESAEGKAIKILKGLGFDELMRNKPTKSLSGGWRMRVALARALFVQPDVLLLDEPTNHLDLDAVMWLEDYCQDCPFSVVIVSHDRTFLNSVCENIMHFHDRKLKYYTGNYDQYEKTRAEQEQNQSKLFTKQQKEATHMQEFIDKYRATKQLSSLVQSRIKALEKMQLSGVGAVVTDPEIKFDFPEAGKCPIPYLELDKATFGYGEEQPILKNIRFIIDDTCRIALVGPNGAGKSTLLKMLTCAVEVQDGYQRKNPHCRVAQFNQHHMDQLDLALTPAEQLVKLFPGSKQEDYRGHLSRFGIQAQLQTQKLKFLSGGQKSRVALAIAAWYKPHLMILDEPTNHLDIDAVNALTQALNAWDGGVLVVSHDEHFISSVCSSIWIVRNQSVKQFHGDFDDYKLMLRKEREEDEKN